MPAFQLFIHEHSSTVAGNTGTIVADGNDAHVVLFGDGVTSYCTPAAVATVHDTGGITAAIEIGIMKGIASAFANLANSDFNLD